MLFDTSTPVIHLLLFHLLRECKYINGLNDITEAACGQSIVIGCLLYHHVGHLSRRDLPYHGSGTMITGPYPGPYWHPSIALTNLEPSLSVRRLWLSY